MQKKRRWISKIVFIFLILFLFEAGESELLLNNQYSWVSQHSILENLSGRLFVGGNGPGNYSSIQEAINNASENDTIFVYNGTYYENIIVNKTLRILGENITHTIIDGDAGGNVLIITKDNVTIYNFTIRNSKEDVGSTYYAGIKILSNNATIDTNKIVDNNCAIIIQSSFGSLIEKNWLKNNDYGIYLTQSYENHIHTNEIIKNQYGFYLIDDSIENSIHKNNVTENSQYGGHIKGTCTDNLIFHNYFDNEQNAKDKGSNTWDNEYPSGGNYWSDYTGIDGDGDLIGDTPYNISGGDNQDRYPLMETISTDTIYVDDDYTSENVGPGWNIIYFKTIQKGINAAINGTTIQVAPGEYRENVRVNKSINLTSTNKDMTIINGQGEGDVIKITSDAVNITGFTIKNSGILNSDAAVHISSSNNKIRENSITQYSTAIICKNSVNNIIKDNEIISSYEIDDGGVHGVGIQFDNTSYSMIINNNIKNNFNDGITFEEHSSNNTIAENTIADNQHYALWIDNTSNDNLFHHNILKNNNKKDDNKSHAHDLGGNLWDDGYPSGGNYWDDYSGNDTFHGPDQNISGSDGFGDEPYMNITPHNNGNRDRYPIFTFDTQIHVDDDYTEIIAGWNVTRFNRIQPAIDKAEKGDTIIVHEGFYLENIIINKSIILSGSNKKSIINGAGKDAVIEITAQDVTLHDFKIKNSGSSKHDAGILLLADQSFIYNNTIKKNQIGVIIQSAENTILENDVSLNRNNGIVVEDGRYNWIVNNTIAENDKDGIVLHQTTSIEPGKNSVEQNTIQNNKRNGVRITESFHNIIKDNTIELNRGDGIFINNHSSHNEIKDNMIFFNLIHGVHLENTKNENGFNVIEFNTIEHQSQSGIFLIESENNSILGNEIRENNIGISLQKSKNNSFSLNNVTSNDDFGFHLTTSYNNSIFNNNIANEKEKSAAINAVDTGDNHWNETYGFGGNYWDNYSGTDIYYGPNQQKQGKDGIYDDAYSIIWGNNFDYFPYSTPNGWDHRLMLKSVEGGLVRERYRINLILGIRLDVVNFGQKEDTAEIKIKMNPYLIDPSQLHRINDINDEIKISMQANEFKDVSLYTSGEIWGNTKIKIGFVEITIKMDEKKWQGTALVIGSFFFLFNEGFK